MRVLLCLSCLFLIGVILTAGCAQTQQGPQEQPVQTASSSASAQASSQEQGSDEYPAPPEEIAVSAQINEKDDIDKTITVIFTGGKGQNLVKSSWIIFQPADGPVERFDLAPRVRSEVVLQGSSGEDSIKVYANYYNGNTYKIAEKKVRTYQHI